MSSLFSQETKTLIREIKDSLDKLEKLKIDAAHLWYIRDVVDSKLHQITTEKENYDRKWKC